MTSELYILKTNEFKRRRKLRLQQVREQSNDIAKLIRQRANVEKSRQIVDLDAKKQKEYFQRQERLVKQLQELYTKGINNVGAGHSSASELKPQDKIQKADLSKQRGKEAAASLRRVRQEKLDEQKKLLDRKLKAREAANQVSKEKSVAIANKILIPVKDTDVQSNTIPDIDKNDNEVGECEVKCNDMATQWDLEPSEWEPNIPSLALHKDDKDSLKETNNNVESKSDKSKRPDLFALSEEMPSSLRGGLSTQEDRVPAKSALTLVSEYLQNRGLRLRQTDTAESIKNKNMDELHSLKQTILRTRSSKAKGNNVDIASKSNAPNSAVPKKSSVTMYNHSTRNVRDIPHNERLVIRDLQVDDDAYSQAMKESSSNNEETHHQKLQEVRSKVAMRKQTIEKEYKDTMSFLNSLPKDMENKPIRRAFMDEDRQQSLKDNRQQKLQQEYKKIVKDSKKHSCRSNRGKSKSPSNTNEGFDSTDFQYSWMPVPESDGNLAIHAIPTSLKEGKAGNTVKFSKVDSYHEYRSRHKHTPPTKDTQQPKRFVEAVLIQNSSDSEQDSTSSETSGNKNIQLQKNDNVERTEKLSDAERIIIYKILDSKNEKSKNSKIMRDIAKSLTMLQKQNDESQSKKTLTKKTNCDSDKIMAYEELKEGVYKTSNEKGTGDNIASMYYPKSGEKIKLAQDEIKFGRPCRCGKSQTRSEQQDKGTTSRNWESGDIPSDLPRSPNSCEGQCVCGCRDPSPKSGERHSPTFPRIEENTDQRSTIPPPPSAATSTSSFKTATDKGNKAAANDKADKANNALSDGGYIKLVDEGGEEAGKFYIGTSGFLKDDNYEVVIQLRKKGDEKELPTEPKKKTEDYVASRESVSKEISTVDAPFENLGVNAARSISDATKLITINKNKKQGDVVNVESEGPIITQLSSEDQPQKDIKDVSEKGVSTCFQDTFAIPSHMPKSVSNPRPAISAYTQTSMSSPVHRPMLFHMSSSTSTAYMSPPEMILPKFLIPDHIMSEDDFYDPKNFNIQDKLVVTDEQEYSENYECNCRKCRLARKITLCKTNAHNYERADYRRPGQMATPPNTAKSIRDEFDSKAVTDSNSKVICQCRKCSSRNRLSKPTNSNRHVDKHEQITTTKHSSQNLRPSSSTYSAKKGKHNRRSNPNLNPIVRDYVNKLLALNKESLKAVQVLDQDCSSVATPGSSIINHPDNNGTRKSAVENKISLEQIKTMLKQQILDECIKKTINNNSILDPSLKKLYSRASSSKKKSIHKVKSLNISKKIFRTSTENKPPEPKTTSLSSSAKEDQLKMPPLPSRSKIRSKSIPTPRLTSANPEAIRSKTRTNLVSNVTTKQSNVCTKSSKSKTSLHSNFKEQTELRLNSGSSGLFARRLRAVATSTSPNSEISARQNDKNHDRLDTNMSTQTSINVDSEINFLKFDEDKIQNMEKIADLTEKCTKRLSNLAKVLEEVRRNKSLAYSQISTSDAASDSDQKSDRNANKISANACQPLHDTQKSLPSKTSERLDATETTESAINGTSDVFVPFLSDIPKPVPFKTPNLDLNYSSYSSNKSNPASPTNDSYEHHLKGRGKPPPALSRIHLKHVQDNVIPHELSTVVEVDSPMSVKLKSQTSRNDTKLDVPDSYNRIDNVTYKTDHQNERISLANPDILVSNVDIPGQTLLITESSDDSKVRMIDMNQFNEIMLKPFFSLQEYAKHHNVEALDDGSNLEDFVKNDLINDELSSLHSDASLPDVISELLKRNIISEPFKFDTGSNVNSTTMSSESTLSVLALSKSRKEKKKSSVMFQKKENVAETSDTMSISSNPDLENAFKKLGMGWASSTLKKTKERLALSSSSNTSSSSLSLHKVKSFNHEIPALVTDTVSSVLNLSGMKQLTRNATDAAKNAEQQTLLTNSMTVKEFLTQELAKKITFNNNSRNDTEEEFVSLFETKMPEEMKLPSRMGCEESIDNNSMRSGNRARTSTPVQLFKSMNYQSSSSSNVSNGLFSNADDLSSVKHTSNSMKHSTSDKDDLTIPNFSLRMKKDSSE